MQIDKASGFWLLASLYSFLATRCSQLATVNWPLAVHCEIISYYLSDSFPFPYFPHSLIHYGARLPPAGLHTYSTTSFLKRIPLSV